MLRRAPLQPPFKTKAARTILDAPSGPELLEAVTACLQAGLTTYKAAPAPAPALGGSGGGGGGSAAADEVRCRGVSDAGDGDTPTAVKRWGARMGVAHFVDVAVRAVAAVAAERVLPSGGA